MKKRRRNIQSIDSDDGLTLMFEMEITIRLRRWTKSILYSLFIFFLSSVRFVYSSETQTINMLDDLVADKYDDSR